MPVKSELRRNLGNDPLKSAEQQPMTAYRMYFRGNGQIRGRQDFETDDDVAAIRIARLLYDTCSDVCDCFDLWRATRHIDVPQSHHPQTRLADLIEAHRNVVTQVEERIKDSRWAIAESQRLIEAVSCKDQASKGGTMQIAVVLIAAGDDFGAILKDMRLWLDQRRFEPSTFTYHDLNPGTSVRVSFKVGEEAQAFARRFGGSLQYP